MKELIQNFPAQVKDALALGNQIEVKKGAAINHVLIAGMGGSGIGGVITSSLVYKELKVPVTTVASYDIPASVNENTLFIGCSFSGNTEETISCLEQALAQKAQIHLISSGGKFAEMAEKHGLPLSKIPGESKCPRANIGYSLIQVMFVLHKHGLIGDQFIQDFQQLISLLEVEQAEMEKAGLELAQAMKDKLPIVYADSLIHGTAVRFQQQINENGKHMAHTNAFPEMNHNELVGWEYPANILSNSVVIRLSTSYDHPQVVKRFEISEKFFNEQSSVIKLEAKGKSLIEQIFYLIHLTDWSSFYLADVNGTDPFPVKKIDFLKSELAK